MKQLRLLGTALIAVFALGVVLAGSASAAEAGLLYLTGGSEFKFTATGGAGELKTGKSEVTIKCEKVTGEGKSKGESGHVILGTGTLDFTGCKQTKKESKTACNSKGDASGTILVPFDFHLINVLKETTLEPGIAILPSINNEKNKTFEFTCAAGTAITEVRGWDKGLVLTSNLSTGIESAEVHFFAGGETCDSSDTLCKELAAFEANLAGTFEPGELIQLATLSWKPDMVVDD